MSENEQVKKATEMTELLVKSENEIKKELFDYTAWFHKAYALYELQRYSEAIPVLDEAWDRFDIYSALKPSFFYLKFLIGVNLAKQQTEPILKNLRKTLEYKEELVHEIEQKQETFGNLRFDNRFKALILLFKGVVKFSDEEDEAALASIEEAFELDPDLNNYFVALNTKANLLRQLDRSEEALALYDQALQYPYDSYDSYTGWRNKAELLSQLERYQEAVESFDKAFGYYWRAEQQGKALKDRRAVAEDWNSHGWALMELGENDKALESFNKAVEWNPQDGWLVYDKVCFYCFTNQIDLALETLQEAIKLEPEVKESAETDEYLENIRSDQRFQAILASS